MKKLQAHGITGVFVFLLLGLFALFSTAMVLLGANVYRGIAARADDHNGTRVTSAYLRSMLRAEDGAGVLSVEEAGGLETVTMRHVWDGDSYVTRLYVYDGALREWFAEEAEPFEPAFGEEVCEAQAMTAELSGGLLTVRVQSGGVWRDVCYAPRSRAE